jgi:hypothetical protein
MFQKQTHPVIYALMNFVSKFTQSPNSYPIRFYKKTQRFRKYNDMHFVK